MEYIEQSDQLKIMLDDGLPNDIFDHPLTIQTEIPTQWIGKTIGIYQDSTLICQFEAEEIQAQFSLKPNEKEYLLKLIVEI